jgi:hypothetical protein
LCVDRCTCTCVISKSSIAAGGRACHHITHRDVYTSLCHVRHTLHMGMAYLISQGGRGLYRTHSYASCYYSIYLGHSSLSDARCRCISIYSVSHNVIDGRVHIYNIGTPPCKLPTAYICMTHLKGKAVCVYIYRHPSL